eukprot:TRINITY_DN5375_c0_g1_i2.p1 TRINITY_DN5375_c0_g1~~TRINITY_DN5375_c0_g1_i2.p1  ORF type:complete len:658 (-),score=160.68 TRINITY_DN5375_c0_g1_i2:235-2184(-)
MAPPTSRSSARLKEATEGQNTLKPRRPKARKAIASDDSSDSGKPLLSPLVSKVAGKPTAGPPTHRRSTRLQGQHEHREKAKGASDDAYSGAKGRSAETPRRGAKRSASGQTKKQSRGNHSSSNKQAQTSQQLPAKNFQDEQRHSQQEKAEAEAGQSSKTKQQPWRARKGPPAPAPAPAMSQDDSGQWWSIPQLRLPSPPDTEECAEQVAAAPSPVPPPVPSVTSSPVAEQAAAASSPKPSLEPSVTSPASWPSSPGSPPHPGVTEPEVIGEVLESKQEGVQIPPWSQESDQEGVQIPPWPLEVDLEIAELEAAAASKQREKYEEELDAWALAEQCPPLDDAPPTPAPVPTASMHNSQDLGLPEAEALGPGRKVLMCGDLDGKLDVLEKLLQKLKAKDQHPDFVIAVGRFLPDEKKERAKDFIRRSQDTLFEVPVYFVDSASEDLVSQSLAEKKAISMGGGQRIVFLGAVGLTEIQGLRVAFLSGHHDAGSFRSIWGSGLFKDNNGSGDGAHYTEHAVRELKRQAKEAGGQVDVLVTSEWPDTYWSTAAKQEAPNPVAKRFTSPAVRQLFFQLKPRYHVHAGANKYRLRKADQGPHGFVSTSLALGEAREESDEAASEQWYHLLTVRHARVDLEAARAGRVMKVRSENQR